MRIAVANWSARRVGGVEEYLSLAMPALGRAGMEVAFWHETDAPRDRELIQLPEGALDICVDVRGVESALAGLREWAPDVIYAHGLVSGEIERRLVEIAPSVFFMHGYTGTCISGGKTWTRPAAVPCSRTFGRACLLHFFPHGCGGRSPITMWRQFQRQQEQLAMLRRYAAVVTHTRHMQDEAAKHGLVADIVPYPVGGESGSCAYPPPKTSEHASPWQLLYVGRMDYLKGGRHLLDALPEVAVRLNRPLSLTLAGDGPDRHAWEARARGIRSPRVTVDFTGWISQARVNDLLGHTHLLVVPSLWPEPFGSVGPLAARRGVPAAAFDVGGISEWLIDGETGHLAAADPPSASGLARAMTRCLDDAEHFESLRRGACRRSGTFTIERHIPALLDILSRASHCPVEPGNALAGAR